MSSVSASSDLQAGWCAMQDQHGVYYLNLLTKQTTRNKPVKVDAPSGPFVHSNSDMKALPPLAPPPSAANAAHQNVSMMQQQAFHQQQQQQQQQIQMQMQYQRQLQYQRQQQMQQYPQYQQSGFYGQQMPQQMNMNMNLNGNRNELQMASYPQPQMQGPIPMQMQMPIQPPHQPMGRSASYQSNTSLSSSSSGSSSSSVTETEAASELDSAFPPNSIPKQETLATDLSSLSVSTVSTFVGRDALSQSIPHFDPNISTGAQSNTVPTTSFKALQKETSELTLIAADHDHDHVKNNGTVIIHQSQTTPSSDRPPNVAVNEVAPESASKSAPFEPFPIHKRPKDDVDPLSPRNEHGAMHSVDPFSNPLSNPFSDDLPNPFVDDQSKVESQPQSASNGNPPQNPFAIEAPPDDANHAANASQPVLDADDHFAELPPEPDDEGHDDHVIHAVHQPAAAAPDSHPDPMMNASSAAVAAEQQHREEHWGMLVEAIGSNCPLKDQYSVFKAIRKVAQNLLIDDDKYRTLYADNDMVQKKILGRVGGYEFLLGIGFKQGMDDNELVCQSVDGQTVHAAIAALNAHIKRLKQSRAQWDPNYQGAAHGDVNMNKLNGKQPLPLSQPQPALNEEDRMMQEAIRMSREQHVKDKIMEQQRLLDSANRRVDSIGPQHFHQYPPRHEMPRRGPQFGRFSNTKSVNQYTDHEEDDHKADFM